MKIWVTRPYAYECYMGGWRDCYIHLVKPFYDHRLQYHHHLAHEYGWYYGNHNGIRGAKDFFKQDPILQTIIWDTILLTLSKDGDTYHEEWYNDKNWELKCTRNFKRTLIEVDLYKKDAYLIEPEVLYIGNKDRILTVDVPDELAVSSCYPCEEDEYGKIPF